MGETFVGGALGAGVGHAFGLIVSIVFALLLLSAVNTAIVDLITIQFLMARDRELPNVFQRLNKWGVPSAGMLLATLVPVALVILVKDMVGLADLYAVGVVGAIATNLGATATDWKLPIKTWERTLMFGTFIVMAAIEVSLLVDKPKERRMKIENGKDAALRRPPDNALTSSDADPAMAGQRPYQESMLCAIRGTGRTLDFAIREARETGRRLYLLFVREQRFMTEQDTKRKWQEDPEAAETFTTAKQKAGDDPPICCYAVSESAAATIVDITATLGASRLILGAPKRNALINILRGNVVSEVSDLLPEEIDLIVYA
jgi:nucleotide-binding universal stress UspA family protein